MSSRYTTAETRALVEGYSELKERKDTSRSGLRILLMLADLDRAIRHMPPKEYRAVLLHGLLGLDESERMLGVSRATMYRMYLAGITFLTNYLNGRDTAL